MNAALTEPMPSSEARQASSDWSAAAVTGFVAYYLTSLVAVFGLVIGYHFVELPQHALAKRSDLLRTFANWDGAWYVKIEHSGYHYQPHQASDVAFFPAYPLTARLIAHCTGCRIDLALLLISHLSLAAAFVVLAAYTHLRFPDLNRSTVRLVVFAFGLWPTTCFWRFAYSESMFLLEAVLVFYALERRWPPVVIALVIGLATATRPVGVALLVPFVWHLWRNRPESRTRQILVALNVPLACWGILAYMVYLWAVFDAPLAFAQTQNNWRLRPPVPWLEKATALVTLEPIWSVYVPSSPAFWQRFSPEPIAGFSLQLANPLYYLAAVGLTVLGWRKRWLSPGEVGYAIALFGIVYLTRSYEMCMGSTGRFTATAFPIFLVAGRLLANLPAPFAGACLALCGFFLGVYSALFAAWYRVL